MLLILRTTDMKILFVLMFTFIKYDSTTGAPQNRPQKAGPCLDMNCLHGVLMHGDSEQGDGHTSEHKYERLQREDALKQQKEKPGPCEGGDCLHELLHSEGDIIHRSHDKIGPEQQKKPGPEEGMEYLHGVLMHGDEKPGVTHKREDEEKQKPETKHEPDGPCLDCLEGRLHSLHLDLDNSDADDETEHHEGSKKVQFGTTDPDELLHGEGGSHAEDSQQDQETNQAAQPPGVSDPDHLLHSDGSDHSNKQDSEEENKDRPKPLVFDPDKMLHADGESHDDRMMQQKPVRKDIKIGTFDLESVLHGEDAKGIHSNKPERTKERTNKERPGTFDQDALLHGGVKDAHVHREDVDKVELGKATDQHEHDDFKRWMAEKIKKGEAMKKEGGALGFSQPFISDTVMSEIDQMKQRYMLRDWEEVEEKEDTDDSEDSVDEDNEQDWEWEEYEEGGESEDEEETEELEAEDYEKELLELREALMEDNSGEPCINCDEGKSHAHGERLAFKKINVHDRKSREYAESLKNDMRHELDNIGNTKPLRSDVDIMLDNERRKSKHERDNGL